VSAAGWSGKAGREPEASASALKACKKRRGDGLHGPGAGCAAASSPPLPPIIVHPRAAGGGQARFGGLSIALHCVAAVALVFTAEYRRKRNFAVALHRVWRPSRDSALTHGGCSCQSHCPLASTAGA
jgi:hypothetical protein